MEAFKDVIAALIFDNIRSMAMRIRHDVQCAHSGPSEAPSAWSCRVDNDPRSGSFNLAYPIIFEDNVRWVLRVPRDEYRGAWNDAAAESLESEALTMRLIARDKTIPVPTVHHFSSSMDNEIGCPFILMDCVMGKPLHEVWFNKDISPARNEQIRLRSLSDIATAMVALSGLTCASSGSIHFDSNGVAIGMKDSRVMDFHNGNEDEEIPRFLRPMTNDPLSSLLSILEYRGTKSSDTARVRGTHTSLRILIEWAFNRTKNEGDRQFVLAHPDLDVQNILLNDDGSLSGVIDWDGVTAVPHAIGPLNYPLWLMQDWRISGADGWDFTLEQLSRYRQIYAQLVETTAFRVTNNAQTSEQYGDITRASIVFGSIGRAINIPEFSEGILENVFDEMGIEVDNANDGDDADDDGNLESEESESDESDGAEDGDDGTDSDDEDLEDDPENNPPIVNTQLENNLDHETAKEQASPCQRCIADAVGAAKEQDARGSVTKRRDEEGKSIMHESHESNLSGSATPCSSSPTINAQPDPLNSKKVRFGKLLCKLGEQGCRGLAKRLHRKGLTEDFMDLLPPAGMTPYNTHLSKKMSNGQHEAVASLNCLDVALRRWGNPCPVTTSRNRMKDLLQWLCSMLSRTLRGIAHRVRDPAETIADSEVQCNHVQEDISEKPENQFCPKVETDFLLKHTPPSKTAFAAAREHEKGCPKAVKDTVEDEVLSVTPKEVIFGFEDVWGRIGREIQNAGLSTAMIKDDQINIANVIINGLRKKRRRIEEQKEAEELRKAAEAEKEKRKRKKARKAAKAAKAAEKAMTEGLENGDKQETEATKTDDALLQESSPAKQDEAITGPEEEDEQQETPLSAGTPQKIGLCAGNSIAITSGLGAVKDKAAGKPVDYVTNDNAQPHAEDDKENHEQTIKSIQIEHNLERPDDAGKPAVEVASSEAMIPQASTGAAEDLSTKVLPTITLDGKPYPRNRPCPCGSRHKFKKCCGRIDDVTKTVEATKPPSISPGQSDLPAESSTSPSEKPSSMTSLSRSQNDGAEHGSGSSTGHVGTRNAQISEGQGQDLHEGMEPQETKVENVQNHWMPAEDDPTWSKDRGGFTMNEILVALGKGELDEERLGRMKEHFDGLMDRVLGEI